jgi:hypothetical protein
MNTLNSLNDSPNYQIMMNTYITKPTLIEAIWSALFGVADGDALGVPVKDYTLS